MDTTSNLLEQVQHRPFALPTGGWIQEQTWHDLLFAHWPVPAESMRQLVPEPLEIDTFEGEAWIGVIPFRISRIRLRKLWPLPGVSSFTELNVRTYVRCGKKPGVFFFSLDASSFINAWIARHWYHLPYHHAEMSLEDEEGTIHFESRRRRVNATVEFRASYRPVGDVFHAQFGSLEHFFTERYCLFAHGRQGAIFDGNIHHGPWPLQNAKAAISHNTMTLPLGITLPAQAPVLHFARALDVLVWRPQPAVL